MEDRLARRGDVPASVVAAVGLGAVAAVAGPGDLAGVVVYPELAIHKLKNTAYKFSFLLVPLLPFMWLMFLRRRDIAVYDHAVFSLYSLSFMALLTVTAALLSMTPLNGHLGWLLWIVPVHVFLQLRGTYGLTRWGASWRTITLLSAAGVVIGMFLLFTMWVGWH
jgi:hypothetical protein